MCRREAAPPASTLKVCHAPPAARPHLPVRLRAPPADAEFVVFHFFTSASCLEGQFRFLWALYDRDGDGVLGRDDLWEVLQARAVPPHAVPH